MQNLRHKTNDNTLLNLSPSLTSGTVGNERCRFITKLPRVSVNKFDITSKRSDVVFTGKKRRRGTLIPKQKRFLNPEEVDFTLCSFETFYCCTTSSF
jgi:hypothetical protein